MFQIIFRTYFSKLYLIFSADKYKFLHDLRANKCLLNKNLTQPARVLPIFVE